METKEFEQGIDYEITEISANIGFTINLGNYESTRVDQGLKARLLKDQNAEDIKILHRQLNNTLRKRVFSELKQIINTAVIEKEKLEG